MCAVLPKRAPSRRYDGYNNYTVIWGAQLFVQLSCFVVIFLMLCAAQPRLKNNLRRRARAPLISRSQSSLSLSLAHSGVVFLVLLVFVFVSFLLSLAFLLGEGSFRGTYGEVVGIF